MTLCRVNLLSISFDVKEIQLTAMRSSLNLLQIF